MALTEVILREKINSLGAEADVVKVKAGYARNFLIPSGKAYEATKGNLRQIENLQKARVQREAEELVEAQELSGKNSVHRDNSPVYKEQLLDSSQSLQIFRSHY